MSSGKTNVSDSTAKTVDESKAFGDEKEKQIKDGLAHVKEQTTAAVSQAGAKVSGTVNTLKGGSGAQ